MAAPAPAPPAVPAVAQEATAAAPPPVATPIDRLIGLLKKSFNAIKKFFLTFSVNHDSTLYYVWLWIMSVAVLYNVTMVPLRASFVDGNLDNLISWFCIDYIIADPAYLIDMFLKSRTTYFQQGITVRDVSLLQKRYFRTWQFALDIISILPTDLLYIGVGVVYAAVRFNRLLRISRLFEMMTRVESTATYPNVFRMATTVFAVLIALHYTAIFYNSYSKGVGFGTSKNEMSDFQLSLARASKPFFTRYTYCLYWATMTLCFIGETPPGNYPHERLIQASIWLLGLMMFGAIVGRIGIILENVGAASDQYQRQVDTIRLYLHLQKVSHDLYNKVMMWFGYAYDNRVLGGEEKVLKPLPEKMKAEIASDMHLASLKKVVLFADLDNNVLIDLVTSFHLQVFSPGDFVCKKGDIGREMYVVKRGNLEVVSDDGQKIFVTLRAGSVFGEISLLNIPGSKTGNRRTANVRSKGYSDLFSLSKDDLYSCLQDYPDAMRKLMEKGTEILRKENKIDEEAITSKQRAEVALKNRIAAIERGIEETETRFARLIADIGASRKSATRRIELLEQQMNLPPMSLTREDGSLNELGILAPTSMSATPSNDVLVRGLGAIPTVKLVAATPTSGTGPRTATTETATAPAKTATTTTAVTRS